MFDSYLDNSGKNDGPPSDIVPNPSKTTGIHRRCLWICGTVVMTVVLGMLEGCGGSLFTMVADAFQSKPTAPSSTATRLVEIKVPGKLQLADKRTFTTPGSYHITRADKAELFVQGIDDSPILGEADGKMWLDGLFISESPRLSGSGLSAYATIPLSRLELGHCLGLQNRDIQAIPSLFPHLTEINTANNPQLTNEAFGGVIGLPLLNTLNVSGCSVDDQLVHLLAGIKQSMLAFADFSFTQVTDDGVLACEKFVKLQTLRLVNCDVSKNAKDTLKARRPQLIIEDVHPRSLVAKVR